MKKKYEVAIGQIFGDRTILEMPTQDYRNRRWVKCECYCGDIRDVQLSNLVNGKNLRCISCSIRQKVDPELIVGQTFNFLTITKYVGIKQTHRMYEVQCICGIKIIYKGSFVISGRKRRCSKRCPSPDMFGKKFNDWTIISFYGHLKSGSRGRLYNCQCVCGSIYPVRASSLFNGFSKRCRPCAIRKTFSKLRKKKNEQT